LIAYFIGNIPAKKISKSIHVRQSYSKPKVGRFLDLTYGGSMLASLVSAKWNLT